MLFFFRRSAISSANSSRTFFFEKKSTIHGANRFTSTSNLPRPTPPTSTQDAAARGGKKELAAGTRIDINKASAEELQRLPGVGPVLAGRIIAEREKKRFDSAADLRRVSGIGAKTLEKLRPFLTFGAPGDNEVAVVQ